MNNSANSINESIPKKKVVFLNQDIGYLLVGYLNGLDAINFMKETSGTEQFHRIEITEDRTFNRLFMKLNGEQKVKVPIPCLDFYLETCGIDSDGYLFPLKHQVGEPPLLRLFIHPTFTTNAFSKLCFTYKTNCFQCYSRLIPLNTHSYVANFFVLDYFEFRNSIGLSRQLNVHEEHLFKSKSR